MELRKFIERTAATGILGVKISDITADSVKRAGKEPGNQEYQRLTKSRIN